MPERIRIVTSLTDDTIEMKYTSAQADLETVPGVGGEGWVGCGDCQRVSHAKMAFIPVYYSDAADSPALT